MTPSSARESFLTGSFLTGFPVWFLTVVTLGSPHTVDPEWWIYPTAKSPVGFLTVVTQ
ncbi:hypothetical protein M407DRAFT_33386 [Tulasnella calospora MUT 4182]|uniref:Uncharacterized protein n=1 Tax=Tulasnella calospora MUT 4182 TaxID=1051891 RepID=A0A0C3L603_9AGAM|nr:hypothetical protein M407DRAFT_33386 [Tulasnella calospora MUT 4182]